MNLQNGNTRSLILTLGQFRMLEFHAGSIVVTHQWIMKISPEIKLYTSLITGLELWGIASCELRR